MMCSALSLKPQLSCRSTRYGTALTIPASTNAGLTPSTSGRLASNHIATPLLWQRCSTRSASTAVQASGKRTQSSVSSSLIAVLKDEAKYERESYRRSEELVEGPPNGFELSDEPGSSCFFLQKEFGNEDIFVRVNIHEQQELDEDEDAEDYEDEDAESMPVVFQVNIIKDDDSESQLAFDCESDGDYLTIRRAQLKNPDHDDLELPPYMGPVFQDLDDTLQQALVDYLEERGINSYLGDYIRLYVRDKATLEYQRWLNGIRDFIAR